MVHLTFLFDHHRWANHDHLSPMRYISLRPVVPNSYLSRVAFRTTEWLDCGLIECICALMRIVETKHHKVPFAMRQYWNIQIRESATIGGSNNVRVAKDTHQEQSKTKEE